MGQIRTINKRLYSVRMEKGTEETPGPKYYLTVMVMASGMDEALSVARSYYNSINKGGFDTITDIRISTEYDYRDIVADADS
jgi:hypothetical protein